MLSLGCKEESLLCSLASMAEKTSDAILGIVLLMI